jgi:hypothetical protein
MKILDRIKKINISEKWTKVTAIIISVLSISLSAILWERANTALENSSKSRSDIIKTENDLKEINNGIDLLKNSLIREGLDKLSANAIESESESIKRKGNLRPPYPKYYRFMSYLEESSSDGVVASNVSEAWLMAYIEIHPAEYKYGGVTIDSYNKITQVRDAIIHLVKEKGVDGLIKSSVE